MLGLLFIGLDGLYALHNRVIPTNEHLRTIVRLIGEGHLRPTVQRVFPLAEAAQAHELCQTGHGRGRIVLHITDFV